MSVEIAWDLITSGKDGEALSESIRAFVHAKFQQITLPRFIKAVHVHSFEFGTVCPNIEIKDICDPLPDFYEDDGEEANEQGDAEAAGDNIDEDSMLNVRAEANSKTRVFHPPDLLARASAVQNAEHHAGNNAGTLSLHDTQTSSGEGLRKLAEVQIAPFARSGTPGIPGGTSNMSYFHFPVGGLSGAQTPLAAVAGGGAFATHAWLNDQQNHLTGSLAGHASTFDLESHHDDTPSRPRTAGSISSPELGSPLHPSSPDKRARGVSGAEQVSDDISSSDILAGPIHLASEKISPSDLQVVARVTYNGDVRMMLTAEIMLDYPMPSFVKIPLKLSITGVAFDGVAILAYIKRKMHFCFLDPEDANAFVGSSFASDQDQPQGVARKTSTMGSLLREIHVETEIGRQESGKQVLKNVGKVERFVLEQVRHIFEDEFVFPSFWTFLV